MESTAFVLIVLVIVLGGTMLACGIHYTLMHCPSPESSERESEPPAERYAVQP